MVRNRLIICILALLWGCVAHAQSGTLTFRVADSMTGDDLAGVVAELRSRQDSLAAPGYTVTDATGTGRFRRLTRGDYCLTLSSLGYDSLRLNLTIGTKPLLLDTLRMEPLAQSIDQVVVETPALRSSQHGDTLSYRASAYRVAFGADASSLISKMPGLELNDGSLYAQGRNIQRVYVDGREFFGNDVMSAIRNIPADMIESIDIYNSQGDQAELTGVDTGEGFTALNIVTRVDKRRGAFGRVYGAAGWQDKYMAGGNVNIFNNDCRLTVIGMVNNVSRQNFSFEDILGTTDEASGPSSNKNFMVKPLAGISTVQALGLNYSDDWGKKATVTASYFFNRTDNHNASESDKQTFTSTDKMVLYHDANNSQTRNLNHRFQSRIEIKFAPRHSMVIRSSLSTQNNHNGYELLSRTDNRFSDDDIRFVYRRHNFGKSRTAGMNGSGQAYYRYRLDHKLHRGFTFGFGGNFRTYDQWSLPRQYTFRKQSDADNETCDTTSYSARNVSLTDREQPGYSINASSTYTHAFTRRSRMSVEYRYTFSENRVDRRTYLMTAANLFPEERNPKQSAEYAYTYGTHRLGGTYQYKFRKTKVSTTLNYQHMDYLGDYAFPYESQSRKGFDNLTYNVVADIHINRNNTMKWTAEGRTSQPRATDLQNIVNTTNRQSIFAGNPGLVPVYTHHITGQYIRTNPRKGRTFTLSGQWRSSPNTVADSLVIDTPNFVIDDEGTLLGEGNQYTKPVNISGYHDLRLQLNYGFPVRWLRSNLNLRLGGAMSRLPSVINGERNNLNNRSIHAGCVLGSNISENIDFRLSYTGDYQVSRSRSQSRNLDNTYLHQQAQAEFTFTLANRVVLRANADYDRYRGYTDDFLEQRLICNAQIGVKMFRNRLGEASLGINDMFDQNSTTFRRSVSGTTLRYVRNQAIGRYVSFQFTYHLRVYKRTGIPGLE